MEIIMIVNIKSWTKDYAAKMTKRFGDRIVFMGLQGSYARGEAKENSDIDVVLILDRLEFDDLKEYEDAVKDIEERKNLCGFISGIDELLCWERSDLFQFCFDTIPIYGSLKDIVKTVGKDDIRRAVSIGACNIYHACCHNILHDKSFAVLNGLLKSAVFVLKAEYYRKNAEYIKTRSELSERLSGDEKFIAERSGQIAPEYTGEEFDRISETLLRWSSRLIREFADARGAR